MNNYSKFEHWFKDKDGAYDENNKYYILSLGNFNDILYPEFNITVEIFKSSPVTQLFDLIKFKKRLKEIIEEFKPDYIYVPFLYLGSTIPKGYSNFKVISFLRDITAEMVKAKGGIRKIFGNLFYFLDYLALKNTDILLYNSPYLENYAKKLGYKKKLIFNPRTITDKEYFEKADGNKVIKKYNLEEKKVILTVARLTKEKNIEMGIKALKYLPEEYVYVIVGEGPEKENLKKLCKKLNVKDRVIFTGFVEHKYIWDYYKAADIFWLLSKSNFEGIPNVILESWYAKVPIIVSKIDALSFIKNEVTGLVLKSWKEKELAKKTNFLLNNPKTYQKLCDFGYKEVTSIIKKHIHIKDLFV